MSTNLTYNASLGLSVLEREAIRRVLEPPEADHPSFSYSDTLFPVFAFLTGFRPLTPKQSLYTMGLGVAHNLLLRRPATAIGSLQSIGIAALLLHTLQASEVGPLVSVASSYVVLKLLAASNNTYPQLSQEEPSLKQPARGHSIQEPMGIATTAATMWMGHCVTKGYLTSNELFITGVSLISFGHLSSYALANKSAASAARWSPSSALVATGISLLNYTATNLGSRLLLHYNVAIPAVRVLSTVGSRAVELYMISSVLEACQVPQWLQKRLPGLTGRLASALVTSTVLVGSALILDCFDLSFNRVIQMYP